jgi:hypothetical protein
MEFAKGLLIPIKCDLVLSPNVFYGDPMTAIYFTTSDDKYGRITFEDLDSIRVSRGEYLPYEDDWVEDKPYCWISIVQNSNWLMERYNYESKYYGDSYEFCGDVDDMLFYFKHYIFSFHDQFVEAIARGFWFEDSSKNLFRKPLSEGHPSLPISETSMIRFETHGITCIARTTTKKEHALKEDSIYHSQKLIEFAFELDGKTSVDYTLILTCHDGKFISILRGFFGNSLITFNKFATFEDAKPYIESYMMKMGK